MSKILIVYFSASGVTKRVAKNIANATGGDLFEIEPEEKYTSEDLNWRNKQSRSSIEMQNREIRQKIKEKNIKIKDYDTILIGFPIWWGVAPTIVNTFIESIDLSEKKLIPFCTSGGSGMSYCENDLRKTYPNYNWKEGKRLNGNEDEEFITNWIRGII